MWFVSHGRRLSHLCLAGGVPPEIRRQRGPRCVLEPGRLLAHAIAVVRWLSALAAGLQAGTPPTDGTGAGGIAVPGPSRFALTLALRRASRQSASQSSGLGANFGSQVRVRRTPEPKLRAAALNVAPSSQPFAGDALGRRAALSTRQPHAGVSRSLGCAARATWIS
jgi:hypothetical protein